MIRGLPEFVRRLKLTYNNMYLLCILTSLTHRLRILVSTLRTRQLEGTVLSHRLYTTARRYSTALFYVGATSV